MNEEEGEEDHRGIILPRNCNAVRNEVPALLSSGGVEPMGLTGSYTLTQTHQQASIPAPEIKMQLQIQMGMETETLESDP